MYVTPWNTKICIIDILRNFLGIIYIKICFNDIIIKLILKIRGSVFFEA